MPYRVSIDELPFRLEVEEIDGQKQKFLVRHSGKERVVEAFSSTLSQYTLLIDNQSFDVFISNGNRPPTVFVNGQYFQLAYERNSEVQSRPRTKASQKGPIEMKASMPGKIVKILVKLGDKVEKSQALMVLEAMKMENEVSSPYTGTIQDINVEAGQNVENGKKLLTLLVDS